MSEPTSDFDWMSFLPGNKQEDDSSLIVEFFVDKKLMGLKSTEAGRPIYEDREYVQVLVKGQDKQVVVQEVKQAHKERWPIAYARFLQKKPAPVVGTPIEQMPGVGPSFAHHLRSINIRTVEDLAGISDESAIAAIGMGARDWIKKAKSWVDQTTNENETLREELEKARKTNAEIMARLAALEASAESEKRPTLTLKKGNSP